MFWTVDTNLDSHGPGVGDIKHTERSLGLYPCPGQTSPLTLSLYCTHTLTAQRKKEMPKIVSVPPGLPAHTRGWLSVLVQAPVLYLRHHVTHMWCTLTKYTKCSSHTFYQTTEVKRKWKHAVNKTSEVSVFQSYKVTWIRAFTLRMFRSSLTF